MKKLFFTFLTIVSLNSFGQKDKSISDYLDVIHQRGQEPIEYVIRLSDDYDLLVFDDVAHNAKEPFDFYQKLIHNEDFTNRIDYIFIEVLLTTSQSYIDKYLNNEVKDSTILIPAFQDDYSGYGWRYKTYFDLLSTIWDVNVQLPESEKIKIICLDPPIYWSALKTREDYDLFQNSLSARDYFMYQKITQTLHKFKKGEKGIFLTNTRHAYKGIKASDGTYHWETNTFFHQWHPGKTYSIRFHNANFNVTWVKDSTNNSQKVSFNWIRNDNGLWDEAFRENGNVPVAIPLKNNVFGEAPYVGTLNINTADNQMMYDAYDGLIFLAPLKDLHFSAKVGFIYTDSFIQELKRRIVLLEGDRLPDFLKENSADSLDDFIREFVKYQEPTKNTLVPTE